jgi:PhnB protein
MATRKTTAKKSASSKGSAKKGAAKVHTKKTMARKAAPKRAAPRKKAQPSVVPQGYHAVTAYLCIDGCANAIDFYRRAFGAQERLRMDAPDGKVGHAELVIGDSAIMLADEFPEMDFHGPRKGEGTTVNMHLYVPDVDAMVATAVAEGARVVRAIEDKFYGDRSGTIEDPFGHVWHLATHKEDLTPAEIKRRGEDMRKAQGG